MKKRNQFQKKAQRHSSNDSAYIKNDMAAIEMANRIIDNKQAVRIVMPYAAELKSLDESCSFVKLLGLLMLANAEQREELLQGLPETRRDFVRMMVEKLDTIEI